MPKKGQFSPELKTLIVESYISGNESLTSTLKKWKVRKSTLQSWVIRYQNCGAEGFIPRNQNTKYALELKMKVVEEYLSGQESQYGLCKKYNISARAVVQKWIKQYNSHEEFRTPNSGGAIYMAKGRNTTLEERIEIVSYCIASDKDYGAAVEKYGISYQQVYSWVKRYEKQGTEGLADRRGKRKEEAAMTETEKLQAELKLMEAKNRRLEMENALLKKLDEIERRRG